MIFDCRTNWHSRPGLRALLRGPIAFKGWKGGIISDLGQPDHVSSWSKVIKINGTGGITGLFVKIINKSIHHKLALLVLDSL